MAASINQNSITIQRETVRNRGGIVILPLREYKKLCERATPTYYLKGKEAEELDKLVEEGLKEYEKGETTSAASLKEALKLHGKRNKKN